MKLQSGSEHARRPWPASCSEESTQPSSHSMRCRQLTRLSPPAKGSFIQAKLFGAPCRYPARIGQSARLSKRRRVCAVDPEKLCRKGSLGGVKAVLCHCAKFEPDMTLNATRKIRCARSGHAFPKPNYELPRLFEGGRGAAKLIDCEPGVIEINRESSLEFNLRHAVPRRNDLSDVAFGIEAQPLKIV